MISTGKIQTGTVVTLLCRLKPTKYRLKARIPFQFDPFDFTDEWTKPLVPPLGWMSSGSFSRNAWETFAHRRGTEAGLFPKLGSCRCVPGGPIPVSSIPHSRCPAGWGVPQPRTGPGRRRRGPARAGRLRGGTCGAGAVPGLRPRRTGLPAAAARLGWAGLGSSGLGKRREQRRGKPRRPGGRREPGAAAAAPEPRARILLRE